MTPEQKAAIAAKLGVDLATLDSDRLIELCLLHRAQPKALESFPNTLAAEINRRFTAAEITRDDVPYSVLQHFANQFTGAAPLFQRLMQEMAASINRDIWFTDNAEAFKAALANEEAAAWLAGQPDILNKCLGNRLALGYIAQSMTAATAILTREEALALWKNAPALWDIWPQHTIGMTVIAKSAELTQYIIDTPAALAAVVASDNAMQPLIASATARRVWVDSEVAMTAVAASQTAMTAVAASQTAMTAVAASQTAMTAVAASQTAMTAVAAVSAALKTVLQTAAFRAALIVSNAVLQATRATAYQTVSASGSGWVKQRAQGADSVAQLNQSFATPAGLVFACLGYYSLPSGVFSIMTHPSGGAAARAATTQKPNTMASVDGISFNGATFTEEGDGYAYAELWAPA